jgi:hypothetical protein
MRFRLLDICVFAYLCSIKLNNRTMTTTAENIEKTTFGEYTIAKDFGKYTVLITKPSPRSRMGIKVVAHYSFRRTDVSRSIMDMNMFVDKFIDTKTKEEAAKTAKKQALQNARKEFVNPYKVGQILYHSWGYDQTNVDFYQVIEAKGKTIVVREVAQDRTETGFMSGQTMPIKDEFIGEAIKKVIQVRMYNDKVSTYVNDMWDWDGHSIGWSSYA